MASSAGIQPINNYAGAASDPARVQLLLDAIPNPDTASSSGSIAGGGFLDEMSPAAAAQLRVELVALKAAVT
jgi:hypothetical protein